MTAQTTRLAELKRHLRPGRVYRRDDLCRWSKSVDRHAQELVKDGSLTKLRNGLYLCPRMSTFGQVPPEDKELVRSFLKENDFLITSFNAYNSLGVGTTQLYKRDVVYNHKRHGIFNLGGRTFDFRRKPRFPRKLTPEFLLVDLLNNLNELAEDVDAVRERALQRVNELDKRALSKAAIEFGKVSTRKLVEKALASSH